MRLFKRKEPSPFILADRWAEMEDVKCAHLQHRHIMENLAYYESMRQSTPEQLARAAKAQAVGMQQAPMSGHGIMHGGQAWPLGGLFGET